MHTRLTEMLGVEHPVMLAGMGGVSYHAVVAAVSDAGGFGTLGAATMSSEQLDSEMATVRAATDKPFGVDLLAALPERMLDDAQKVVTGGASLFVAGLGVPRDVIKILHDGNVLVASMCGKVRHAIAAVEAGCDFVIAQGTEAGGHTGTVATMPLVPQIVDTVGDRVPVVAAGGIFDGRGLAAAITLGADGVWIGTRFIATPEARTVRGYKDALLRTPEDGTVISRGFTGKTLARSATAGPSTSRNTPRSSPSSRSRWHRRAGQRAAPRRRRDLRRRSRQGVLPGRAGRRRDAQSSCRPATSYAASSTRPSTRSHARPRPSSREVSHARACSSSGVTPAA